MGDELSLDISTLATNQAQLCRELGTHNVLSRCQCLAVEQKENVKLLQFWHKPGTKANRFYSACLPADCTPIFISRGNIWAPTFSERPHHYRYFRKYSKGFWISNVHYGINSILQWKAVRESDILVELLLAATTQSWKALCYYSCNSPSSILLILRNIEG